MNLLFSSIGRRGYLAEYFRPHLKPQDRIIGTSNSRWTSGFAHCDKAVLMPDIIAPEYLPRVLETCRDEKIDAVLSFFDPDINRLSHHRDEFAAIGTVPFFPSAEVSDLCFDKFLTSKFAEKHKFLYPKTCSSLTEAMKALNKGEMRFPLMVKPRKGFGSRNLFKARSLPELEVFFQYESGMLIQEWLQEPEYHLDVFVDFQGQVLSVVPKRKIRTRAGETDQAQTCSSPALMEFGIRLGTVLGRLGHLGPLDIDLSVGEDRICILELNPRFGGGYPLSHLANADFPDLIIRLLRGQTVQPQIGAFSSDIAMMKEYGIWGGSLDSLCPAIIDRSRA